MSYRIGLILLLMSCSAAKAQDSLSLPRANAQPPSSQVHRPIAASGASSREVRAEPSTHPITPRREVEQAERPQVSNTSPWKMIGALLLAVGGIVIVAKLLKSLGVGPLGAAKPLPGSVCEVLGVMPLAQRHTLYLLRLGQRVLLVGSTGERLTMLSELTNPEEVATIAHLSQASGEESRGPSFLSRLLSHRTTSNASPSLPPIDESIARRDLEAKLSAFAQS